MRGKLGSIGASYYQRVGDYWNCNRQVKDFEQKGRCGIGLIHWNDTHFRQNLQKYVLAYLCKVDQGFWPRHRTKSRMMRRGALPQMRSVKRGRHGLACDALR
jgi:hypothetical protein